MKEMIKSPYFWIILVLAILIAIRILNPTLVFGSAEFCGESTFGECGTDDDCIEGGCSGEVCKSETELPIITDCIWKSCYDERRFGLNCQCINNQCQWN